MTVAAEPGRTRAAPCGTCTRWLPVTITVVAPPVVSCTIAGIRLATPMKFATNTELGE